MTTTSGTTTPSTGLMTAAKTNAATATEETKKPTVDYESFLKLLTAQLRNQDPLAPMDATQFMTQLAQLSTVEQSMRSNDTLGKVLDTLKSSGMRMDMALLGRKVEVASDQLSLTDGKAQAAYTVEGTPASVKLEVLTSAGSVVYSSPGSLKTGRQVFDWTGKTASGGTAGSPSSFTRQQVTRSRAVRSAQRIALDAESWITPVNPGGRPVIWRSQSSTRVSISVAAGEVCQSMHWAPRVAVSISASTDEGLELAGK